MSNRPPKENPAPPPPYVDPANTRPARRMAGGWADLAYKGLRGGDVKAGRPGQDPAVQVDAGPEKSNPGARNDHSERFVFRAPLPPPGVHQNARFVNPAARNSVIQAYVSDVSKMLRASAGPEPYPRFERAVISLEFIVPDRIHRDVLNYAAAFKPGIDLLCDFRHGRKLKLPGLGIIPDDDSSHLQVGFIKMRVTRPDEDAGVIVTLEPGEGDEGRLFS